MREEIARARRSRDTDLEQALLRWKRLSRKTQAAVVREIAITRHRELRRAYPDILGIAHGRRSRRGHTIDEECITFMVERKWTRKECAARPADALPRVLWTYAPTGTGPERALCAVPTDVECASMGLPVPHGPGIAMSSPERSPNTGAVACAVRVPGDAAAHALTCYHVAAMPDTAGGVPDRPPTATLRDLASPVGATWWKWCGTLEPSDSPGLDAAVIKVPEAGRANLRRLTDDFQALQALEAGESIPNRCLILVPDRDPIAATYKQTWINYDLIAYFGSGPQPVQRIVFEFEIDDPQGAVAGDSGSAVVNANGQQFVGLYIAGVTGTIRRFVLPAYHVLDGSLYGNSGRLEILRRP